LNIEVSNFSGVSGAEIGHMNTTRKQLKMADVIDTSKMQRAVIEFLTAEEFNSEYS
jgi:hypothetical protein